MIPIRNLYYLLCYAWDALEQRDAVEVGELENHQVADLLARVLERGVRDLLRRGLDRDYVEQSSDVNGVRGRIDFAATTSRLLLPLARTHCRHDELIHDVLHNQIIRATLRHLAAVGELTDENRRALLELWRRMGDVRHVRLEDGLFGRVRLHRNNATYGFLINVCKLAHRAVLMDQGGHRGVFADFTRDEGMALLFESFVRNFYRREIAGCRVGRETVEWSATPRDEASASVLPMMVVDTTLDSASRRVVLETKFYASPMQVRFGKQTIRSEHLYQLFAYLKNVEARGGNSVDATGVLLYAASGPSMDYCYDIQGHQVWVTSVDLDRPWQEIHDTLLQIAGTALGDTA